MFPHKLAFFFPDTSTFAKINLTEQATFNILGSSARKLIRLCPTVNYIFGIIIFFVKTDSPEPHKHFYVVKRSVFSSSVERFVSCTSLYENEQNDHPVYYPVT